MDRIATITSKKQLTLPAISFRQAGLKIGQKVLVQEKGGGLLIRPIEKLVKDLSGSLKMPKHWRGRSPEKIIKESKREYFARKKR